MAILLALFCVLVIVALIRFLMLHPPNLASEDGNTTARANYSFFNSRKFSLIGSICNYSSKLPRLSRNSFPHLRYSRHVEIDKTDKYIQVNQYLLKEFIGQGSFGTVQLAYNKSDNINYAMKILCKKKMLKRAGFFGRLAPQRNKSDKGSSSKPAGSASHPFDRIYREIDVLKKLNHPNIVKLVEVLDDPVQENFYLAFELLDLGPVVTDTPNGNPMGEDQARIYFRDLLSGIEYLHHNHVVHRDIKPANLLVGCDGRLRIADFGVSSEFHEAEDIALENTVGTPAFHAPEVLCGDTFYGKAADIWAMGITLYFFVYGVLPFNDANILALHRLIQHQELRFPDENSISAQLKDLLVRLLCKDPNRRITLPEIKEHSWVTCDGTCQEEKEDSCNIQRHANGVFDGSSLRRVFSTLSIPYFSSFSRLVKTMFLKHSFQLPLGDN